MSSRYSIFTPYYGSYASQYEEDVIRLLLLIRGLQPDSNITFDQLDGALLRTELSPRTLYEHASAGRYTPAMAKLDTELGLPVKELVIRDLGLHGEIVTDFVQAVQKLSDESGIAQNELRPIIAGLLALGEETPAPQPTKKTEKIPYYHKSKGQWWK